MSTYLAGTLVTVTTSFTNSTTQAPGDPSTVTLSVSINGATPTIYTYGTAVIVKDSVGNYHAELDTTDLPGTWLYVWDGTGGIQATSASGFVVVAAPL